MYYIMFWIDVSVLASSYCAHRLHWHYLWRHATYRNSSEYQELVSRASINLSAADAVDLSGETLAEADAEKVKEDPVKQSM